MGELFDEDLAEIIYIHILSQTLLDNSILIPNKALAMEYEVPEEDVEKIIDSLIDKGHLLKLGEGHYTVRFNKLDEIK